MQRTENYGLFMPEQNDFYNVDDFNANSYVINEHLKFAEDTANDAFQAVSAHLLDENNPHKVTKAHVGLENVPNVSTNNQTPTYSVPDNLNDPSKMVHRSTEIIRKMVTCF